ncbi:MAG: glycoside hydrolase family 15 protein [Thermoplasmataceae archaeon]
MNGQNKATGGPGITPRWTSSSKDGVGTAISAHSKIWFSVSHGILNEIYYPRIDIANMRDHQFLVTDDDFFSEEKRDTVHEINLVDSNCPSFRITNTCKSGNYSIEKTIFSDPDSDVLIESIRFKNLKKMKLHVYSLMAPHINNSGYGNTAWIGEYKGTVMMFARKDSIVMASCFNIPCKAYSCGYSGVNDGWQDIKSNKKMTFNFDRCEDGNTAITAELSIPDDGIFNFYIGFGTSPDEAALKVKASMEKDPDEVLMKYNEEWSEYMNRINIDTAISKRFDIYNRSLMVIKIHQAKGQIPGAIIASLSIPWGNSKGDNDIGGYLLIWPRDMAEAAESLLIAGDNEGAVSAFKFLMVTQESDGHWFQNLWLDGRSYWGGIQMDETAFPIILAYRLLSKNLIKKTDILLNMIRKATKYIILNGPSTPQDRWEEDGGITPFTVSVEISGLICASEIMDMYGMKNEAEFIREIADSINSNIDKWLYVTNTDLSRKLQIEGYYIRLTQQANNIDYSSETTKGTVEIKNRDADSSKIRAEELISVDALSLVRFGIRSANDERILNTVKVIDQILKVNTKSGPVWHRYNQDGYGEHIDGRPFDGTGKGRGWPLLVGERAHYEIASNRFQESENLLNAMEEMTSPGGLMPEQIWESEDIPEIGLFNGKPSGSAMPLVWAHGEYIKLCKSISGKHVSDLIEPVYERYAKGNTECRSSYWGFNNRIESINQGKLIRIVLGKKAVIHWSIDNWTTINDTDCKFLSIDLYYADFETKGYDKGQSLIFTIFWSDENKWQNEDIKIKIK